MRARPTGLLPDSAAPLLPFLRRLAASGRHVARGYYGVTAAGAWAAHGFTDAWASAAPHGAPIWAMCTSCGAWAALALWEVYRFSPTAASLAAARGTCWRTSSP